MSADDPLPPEDVAAYLDGRLSGKQLERVESVLAGSKEARDELVDASELIATLPARPARFRRPWVLVSGVAAAAVLVVLLNPLRDRSSGSQPIASERPARVDDGTGIQTVVPEDKAIVSPTGVRFSWRAVRGATYQLTLTDAQGRTVWQSSTSDTALILPEAVPLNGPASYYWNVDALAPDGSSTTTGIREIRVPAK